MPATAHPLHGPGATTGRDDTPRRPGWFTRQRLSLTAAAIAALCLLYVAALGGLIATALWLIAGAESLDHLLPDGFGWVVRGVLLLGTGVGILLLAKGLLPTDACPAPLLETPPSAEPDLDALVAYLSEFVQSPAPTRFEFDCGSEVSIRYDGLAGVLRQRLVLHLGLAAASGLSVRELAGLLTEALAAHARGTGPRRLWLIRQVNDTLARAASGGDRVDRWLAARARGGLPLVAASARRLLQLGEAARREIDWLQLQVARVSRGPLAAHERFRDGCARQVTGVPHSLPRNRLNSLRAAAVETAVHARHDWRDTSTLPPDLPRAIAEAAKGRAPRAEAVSTAALLGCDAPAGALFIDLRRTTRRLTLVSYRLQLDLAVGPADLEQPLPAASSAVRQILGGGWVPFVPLGFDGSVARVAAMEEPAAVLAERWQTCARKLMLAAQAETRLDAGLNFAPRSLGLPDGSADILRAHCRELEEELGRLGRSLTVAAHPASRRLAAAAQAAGESRLSALLTRSDRLLPALWELKLNLHALELLLVERLRQPNDNLLYRIGERRRDVVDQLRALGIALRNTPYPIAHPLRRSLERHILPRRPADAMDEWSLLTVGEIAIERLLALRAVVLERLAVAAARHLPAR